MKDPDNSYDPMRERILRAMVEVLRRRGFSKLNMSDVAAQARISRPTLYRSFASKDELLVGFGRLQLELMHQDLAQAVNEKPSGRRLEAVLQVLADFYTTHQQMRGLVEVEPGLVLGQMSDTLPAFSELVAHELVGQVSDPETVAMMLVRIAACHYLVPAQDERLLLHQLRSAAGIS